MKKKTVKLYRKFRALGFLPTNAIHAARVTLKWQSAEDNDRVKLDVVPDEFSDLDILFGDSYNPKANPDIPATRLERERQHEIDRINRDGVWGIVGMVKSRKLGYCASCGHKNPEWKTVDSVFGFVGDDWQNSGYDIDVMAATLKAAGYKV